MVKRSRSKARRLAVQALYSWDMNRIPLSELLVFPWKTEREEHEADIDFARLLVSGSIDRIEEIDEMIQHHVDHWEIERLARVDLAILRISTFSLSFAADIPAQVTIDEAIELGKSLSTDDSFRFINGVLDAIRKDLIKDEE